MEGKLEDYQFEQKKTQTCEGSMITEVTWLAR
jgi:hypothetical protein